MATTLDARVSMAELRTKDLDKPVRDFLQPVDTHLRKDWTVGQALTGLRERQIGNQITYFYVVDADHRLQGVLPTRKLLLSAPEARLEDLMHKPALSLHQDMTLAEAMEEFAMHRLLALPVVDDVGKLLGIVDVQLYAEEAVDLAEAHRTADLYQLIGVSVQQLRRVKTFPAYRARLPWLLGNIVSGLICAVIAAVFQDVLAKVLLLAMFIPLVLTLSESVSMQSMTLALQFLHGVRAPMQRMGRRLVAEWKTVALLAVSCGTLVAMAATFWPQGFEAAGVILLSIALSMTVAATLGTVIPISLHRRKMDPRVAAGPMVLMLVDIVTTAVYLGLATILLT